VHVSGEGRGAGGHAEEEAMSMLTLAEWLEERYQNCLRLAEHKRGEDRRGWLEDAEYFRLAREMVKGQRNEQAQAERG
jgi:hypothetical protein